MTMCFQSSWNFVDTSILCLTSYEGIAQQELFVVTKVYKSYTIYDLPLSVE